MAERPDKEAPEQADAAPDPLAAAMQYEREIAEQAEKIRAEAKADDGLTADARVREMFLQLWPLLKKPIPAGFIVTTGAVEGKPYPSTGVKSLQVFIDRMNNVLTPLFWGWHTEYNEDGKLATVEVWVGPNAAQPILARASKGGVNRASTIGNLYKGSETNAAKRAFAAIGVGHEVYLGASDFDPDTDEDAAKQQEPEAKDPQRQLPKGSAENLSKIIEEAGLAPKLDTKLRSFGVQAISELTVEQGIALHEWVGREKGS